MVKNSTVFLQHIIESIELIENYIRGKNFKEFKDSVQLQDSVFRRLEIIGEAVKNLSDEIKNMKSDIPWKEIAGMRDILIHQYFGVDLQLTWQVITKDNRKIKALLIELLNTI
ncbi:MAG: DUF86 domain-containing protein [Candidatus Heimdallarchaeota archaeon]|nr:DUF86 domain-containing protein [Candidatus Heimdallarchaeota archaeon]